jgi:hypothetical protein
MKSLGQELFLFNERFLIVDAISLLAISLFRFFYDLLWVSFMFLGICPFLLGNPIFWLIVVNSTLLWCVLFL